MRGASKINKHDTYVEDLCGRLAQRYDLLLRNVPLYSEKKRLVGEIDVLACKDGVCDVYEVKCSFRITKAKKQLHKIKKLITPRSMIRNAFFFCGESGSLVGV